MMGIKYTEKWMRKLEGDFQLIQRKLMKASYMLDREQQGELTEALTSLSNVIAEIKQKVGESSLYKDPDSSYDKLQER